MQRRLFGWFGIRGIGSFYYAIFAVNTGSDRIFHVEAEQFLSCVFTVIVASIVVHGISATPLMELYHRRWSRVRPHGRPSAHPGCRTNDDRSCSCFPRGFTCRPLA